MGDGDAGEKTEAATARRRTEARKNGTVVRSSDLVNACCIIAMLMVLPIATRSLGMGTISSFEDSYRSIPSSISMGEIISYGTNAFRPIIPGLTMVLGTCLGVGLVVNFAQVGFVVSGKAITPNFNKLNPIKGLSRFASRNSLFDTAKGLFKCIIFSLLAEGCIRSSWGQLNSLNQMPINHSLSVVGDVLRSLGLRVAGVWAALAGIDYFFQRQQIERSLKMTKEEVKREMKDAEMSPEVRAQRNIRRRRLMKQRMKQAVATADVVVTNPTHYAVALKYEMGKSHAPIVVYKGVDYLAAKMREEATLHNVPIVPNPPLARALYKQCEIGDYVPRELFQAVAEVLAYVYRTLKKVPQAR